MHQSHSQKPNSLQVSPAVFVAEGHMLPGQGQLDATRHLLNLMGVFAAAFYECCVPRESDAEQVAAADDE